MITLECHLVDIVTDTTSCTEAETLIGKWGGRVLLMLSTTSLCTCIIKFSLTSQPLREGAGRRDYIKFYRHAK